MIPYSQQHQVISTIAISFMNKQQIFTRSSNQTIDKDRMFYNPSKYETMVLVDFKFLVLWTVFKNHSTKIGTLQLLKGYDKKDINEIQQIKTSILTYKNTLQNDLDYCRSKIVTPKNILTMLQKEEISILGAYWYLSRFDLSRLQKRKLEQIEIFLEFFPVVKDYILAQN